MGFPREEMEEMMRRWLEACGTAERICDWASALGPFYTQDAEYRMLVGAEGSYVGHGIEAIKAGPLGAEMEGLQGWTYPYERIVIDPNEGTVSGYWRQVSPFLRKDGSPYQVVGLGNTFFRYAGGFQWSFQEDSFDLGQVTSLFMELAADGHLVPALKERIRRLAWGQKAPGHAAAPHSMSRWKRMQATLAMGRIAVIGR